MQRRQRQIQPTDLKARAIGAVVRAFREHAGRSQERLSADCGFDRTYISLLERGIQSPTLRTMFRLCDTLKISFPEFAQQIQLFFSKQDPRKLR